MCGNICTSFSRRGRRRWLACHTDSATSPLEAHEMLATASSRSRPFVARRGANTRDARAWAWRSFLEWLLIGVEADVAGLFQDYRCDLSGHAA